MTECALCGTALDSGDDVPARIPCCLDCYRALGGYGGDGGESDE
jgi:hypothetical protein